MSEKSNGSFELREPIPYEYFEAIVRRSLHELGARGVKFYDERLVPMRYQIGDTAIDIGAGMGEDGKRIAWDYRPSLVYLLEPAEEDDLDTRYWLIDHDLAGRKLKGVEVLPAKQIPETVAELQREQRQWMRRSITYIQPISASAESIPLPDKSVNKVSVIHSIYEFLDIYRSMGEIARIMSDDGMGVIITNGPDDKQVFKEVLRDSETELNTDAPEGVVYTAPQTVSSRVDYNQAVSLARQFFEEVSLVTYQDEMVVTPDFLPLYVFCYNSYRNRFRPPIINSGRFSNVRQKVLLERAAREIQERGYFRDTIDIGAVYFSRPKR